MSRRICKRCDVAWEDRPSDAYRWYCGEIAGMGNVPIPNGARYSALSHTAVAWCIQDLAKYPLNTLGERLAPPSMIGDANHPDYELEGSTDAVSALYKQQEVSP